MVENTAAEMFTTAFGKEKKKNMDNTKNNISTQRRGEVEQCMFPIIL